MKVVLSIQKASGVLSYSTECSIDFWWWKYPWLTHKTWSGIFHCMAVNYSI